MSFEHATKNGYEYHKCRCDGCRQAYNAYRQAYQRKRRAEVNEIKLAAGCMDCGYSEHAVALDFDHLPQYEKVMSIANMIANSRTRKSIETEMAKCEIVCANCHRVRTKSRYEVS